MKKLIYLILSLFVLSSFIFLLENEHPFYVPQGWPKPVYDFKESPLSREKFELGRTLFYDPDLSRDSTISCASCHLQFTGFTHVDHPLSHGIEDQIGARNSPVLINLAWSNAFHWDGGVGSLNKQAINPITHPKEMDNTIPEVLRRLNGSSYYKKRFYAAFGDSVIRTYHLIKALGNFTVSLVSANSKYDQVMRGEKGVQFSDQEQKGLNLFRQQCASCHQEPLFTTNHFKRNGLPLDSSLNDLGRMQITNRKSDSLLFKIPTLRNVEFSFPYMHDGRFKTLRQVMDHYGELHRKPKQVSKELRKIPALSSEEKKDLIAFLKTLSDKEFLYNRDFMFPKGER